MQIVHLSGLSWPAVRAALTPCRASRGIVVTGGAIAGTLTFIVGGDVAVLERARPVLEGMGKNIFHAGAHGAGQTAKICNNMLLGILMAGTAEALALGAANGLDPSVLSDIGTASRFVKNIREPTFDDGFRVSGRRPEMNTLARASHILKKHP